MPTSVVPIVTEEYSPPRPAPDADCPVGDPFPDLPTLIVTVCPEVTACVNDTKPPVPPAYPELLHSPNPAPPAPQILTLILCALSGNVYVETPGFVKITLLF
jgi:hypothetical protein